MKQYIHETRDGTSRTLVRWMVMGGSGNVPCREESWLIRAMLSANRSFVLSTHSPQKCLLPQTSYISNAFHGLRTCHHTNGFPPGSHHTNGTFLPIACVWHLLFKRSMLMNDMYRTSCKHWWFAGHPLLSRLTCGRQSG